MASSTAEEPQLEAVKSNDVPPIPRLQRIGLYLSICIGMFLSLLDTSIVATALYTIGSEFSALDRSTWVALAYTLAYIGFSVPFAALADVIGRRNAYNLAFVLFLAFSLGCGWARSLEQLIAFRTFQGVGGAGLYSLTMVIFPEVTPPNRLNVIGALAGMVVAVAGVSGPVLGGVVTRYATWRWVFWLNGPVALLALVLFNLTWPRPDQLHGVQTRRKWKELDVLGSALIIAASVLIVFSFETAGIDTSAWGTAIFLAPLLVGLLCFAALLCWEYVVHRRFRSRVAAVVPWHLLKERVYMSGVIFTFLMGFPYLALIYTLPMRFQVVNGASSLYAGVWLLPMLGAAAVGSTLGGALSSKVNRVPQSLLAGSILLTLGTGLMMTFDLSPTIDPKTFGFEVLVGLGFGISISTASLNTTVESSLRDAAVAQGIVSQVRVLGGSLGIAASTAILGSTQRRELAGRVSPSQIASLQSDHHALSAAQLALIRQSYADAFTTDMKVCTAISALTILAAACAWRSGPPMDIQARRKQMVKAEMERAKRERAAGPDGAGRRDDLEK